MPRHAAACREAASLAADGSQRLRDHGVRFEPFGDAELAAVLTDATTPARWGLQRQPRFYALFLFDQVRPSLLAMARGGARIRPCALAHSAPQLSSNELHAPPGPTHAAAASMRGVVSAIKSAASSISVPRSLVSGAVGDKVAAQLDDGRCTRRDVVVTPEMTGKELVAALRVGVTAHSSSSTARATSSCHAHFRIAGH